MPHWGELWACPWGNSNLPASLWPSVLLENEASKAAERPEPPRRGLCSLLQGGTGEDRAHVIWGCWPWGVLVIGAAGLGGVLDTRGLLAMGCPDHGGLRHGECWPWGFLAVGSAGHGVVVATGGAGHGRGTGQKGKPRPQPGHIHLKTHIPRGGAVRHS